MNLKLHHIAISVKSIKTSEEFYKKLGFYKVLHYRSDDGFVEILNMKLGDIFLEIFSFKESKEIPELHKDLWENLKIIGVKHFALKTDDIKSTLEKMKKEGIVPENTEISKGRTGIFYFFIKDPDGIFVEIVEDKRKL